MVITIFAILILLVVGIWLIAREQYDRSGTVMLVVIGWVFLIPLSFLGVYITGWHLETGRGEHTGYVTAVQKQGIIYKTGRAYVKTDIQSSQEDLYCVIDEEVYIRLQEVSKTKEKVSLKYLSWFASGVKNCEGEGDVIYDFEVLK